MHSWDGHLVPAFISLYAFNRRPKTLPRMASNSDNVKTLEQDPYLLHKAAMNGELSILKSCVDNILEVDKDKPKLRQLLTLKDKDDGRTILHWCITMQQEDILKYISTYYKLCKIDIDTLYDNVGWTPFHLIVCSMFGFEVIVKFFIKTFDPDFENLTQGARNKTTVLHLIVTKPQKFDLISYFLNENVDNCRNLLKVKDSFGRLPLHLAASNGSCLSIVETMLKYSNKGLINTRDSYSYTPLSHALAEGNLEIALLLVQNGAEYKNDYEDVLNEAVDYLFKRKFLSEIKT